MSERQAVVQTAPSSKKRAFRALWPLALLALALGLAWLGDRDPRHLGDGAAVPTLDVPWSGDEARFDLGAQRGRVVVLAFWATWCPACRDEGPLLSRLSRRLAPSGEQVVGVSIDGASLPQVVEAARGYGMTYPIALATRADIDRFRVSQLPTIYVIAADGTVAASFVGMVSEDTLFDAVVQARDRRVAGL